MARDAILLTGAFGFLGRIIYRVLSIDHPVFTLGLASDNAVRINLADSVPAFSSSFRTVIHAAGKAHIIPRTEEMADAFYQTNLQGSINLLQGLKESNALPQEFVFISTVAVYGQEVGEMIDETHELLGKTPYARSKILAEDYIEKWCKENEVRLTILRLPLLVGRNPPGNLGSMLTMMRRGLYIGIGSGHAKKSVVFAEDVARFILSIADTGGIYNLTDGCNPSILELENALAKMLKKDIPYRLPDYIVRFGAKAGDLLGDASPLNSAKFIKLTTSLTFSDAKARRLTDWKPRPVIDYLSEIF